MTLEDVLQGLPVLALAGDPRTEITGIAYASGRRRARASSSPPCKGEDRDGIDFVAERLSERRGGRPVRPAPARTGSTAAWVQVFDAREALALAAANFYGHPVRAG